MARTRRTMKILATTAVASVMFNTEASAQTQRVVIVAPANANYACCYYTTGWDGFMTNFFGNSTMTDTGFEVPEAEAWSFSYAGWSLWNQTPKPHVSLNVCAQDPRISPDTKSIVSTDGPEIRIIAARQVASVFPNFINRKRDGLVAKIIFSDGGSELYRHTTFYGWQPVSNSLTQGSGQSNCPTTA